MPVENGVKVKGFLGAGKKPGVEVWRIEDFKPVAVPQKQHGKFYKGDSYIILETPAIKGRQEGKPQTNIFFWLGPETSQDESGAAAALAVKLDEELGGHPVQHREVGGNESQEFKKVFSRISLLDGGHASGFKEGKKTFVKALLRVKGKRKVYAEQVPLSVKSLNQGDCFVLDCGRKIFVWNGKTSNKKERFTASRYAQELRDEERAGLAKVILVDTAEEEQEFFYELTGDRRVVPIIKDGGESDESVEQAVNYNLKLYRVKEDSTGNVTMEETGSKPLKRDDLKSDDAFILETGSCVYVWLGKKASKKEKKMALKDADGFIEARSLNPKTAIKILQEDLEPTSFKHFFFPWERVVGYGNTKTYQAGVGITSREKIDQKFGKFEVKSMHARRQSVTSSLPDDGSGKVEVWRIEGFELKPVSPESHGVFYSGDCYVLLYTYYTKNKRERHIIYFWLGNDSTSDEQGTAAAAAIQLDDKYGGEPEQVRVCEGKEPEHFFKIFGNELIIYQGGYKSGFRNVKQSHVSLDIHLLQVRVTGDCARMVEVFPPLAQSLNSSDVFVLHDPSVCFIWMGKGSINDEKEYAKSALHRMGRTVPDKMTREGEEPSQFWQMLGGKAAYGSAKQSWGDVSATDDHPPRLFHCSDASGRFVVEEILDFTQEDLEEDDVMILDAWTELFVWIGKTARREEKQQAIKTAVEYVKADPCQRSTKMSMTMIKQGAEPVSFRSYFIGWEAQMWDKKMSLEDQKRIIQQGNENVDEHAWSMTEWGEKLKPKEYSLEVLQKKGEELPDDVDPTKKELHLEDTEFQKLFQISKKEWEKVPQWKKDQQKKAFDLF